MWIITKSMDRMIGLFILSPKTRKPPFLWAAPGLFPFQVSGDPTLRSHPLPAQALIGSPREPQAKLR